MAVDTLTDVEILDLLACPKRVQNPGSKAKTEGKHVRRDYRVASEDGRHDFMLFTRQSTVISQSFSAGLRWRSKTGEDVILLRCNGPDHPHGNAIEQVHFGARCHIHRATERYLLAGRKIESYADITTAYQSLDGAIHHLTKLANIAGLNTTPDQPELFEAP